LGLTKGKYLSGSIKRLICRNHLRKNVSGRREHGSIDEELLVWIDEISQRTRVRQSGI
jgi:ribosomal protein L3